MGIQMEFGDYTGALSPARTENQDWQARAFEESYPDERRAESSGMVFPDSSKRPLSAQDVTGKSETEISIAKNEIYARHGRPFQNQALCDHFASQPWYQARADYKESMLSSLEKRNAMYLHVVELDNDLNGQRNTFKSESTVEANLPNSVIPDSSHRPISVQEVTQLSSEQLRMAQNEIFARNGYNFQKAELRDYFSQMDWYRPRADFSQRDFSWLEQRNIELLNLVELDRKFGK